MSESERFEREVARLDDSVVRTMAAHGKWRKVPAHRVIMNEGEEGDQIFIILSGRVKVYSSHDNGREVSIATYDAGHYIGELSIETGVRTANVVTLEPCTFSVMSRDALRNAIQSDVNVAFHVIASLIRRVQEATENFRKLAVMDVQERVVDLLEKKAITRPDGTLLVAERMTHQDIAERIGASRDMVQRVMSKLQDTGKLEKTPEGFVIRGRLPRH
jgi:CRP/FNR family transcriptional regulator, cyclic AMP receptor protein